MNNKILLFIIGFFLLASLTGTAASNFNPGSDIQYGGASINASNVSLASFYNLAKDTKDYHFKKQKDGLENLKTISTGGIPPKGPGEIIMYNMPKLLDMMGTVKNKITNIFSTKKMK